MDVPSKVCPACGKTNNPALTHCYACDADLATGKKDPDPVSQEVRRAAQTLNRIWNVCILLTVAPFCLAVALAVKSPAFHDSLKAMNGHTPVEIGVYVFYLVLNFFLAYRTVAFAKKINESSPLLWGLGVFFFPFGGLFLPGMLLNKTRHKAL